MLPQIRFILVSTLSLAAWHVVDGFYAMWHGAFIARLMPSNALLDTPGAVLLSDGRVLDYGRWAKWSLDAGIDPTLFAPFFLALGILGFIGLVLFLQARPVGWAMLLAFSLGCGLRLGVPLAVGILLIAVLLLPATRALLDNGIKVRVVDDNESEN